MCPAEEPGTADSWRVKPDPGPPAVSYSTRRSDGPAAVRRVLASTARSVTMGDDNGVNGDLNANLRCQSTGDPQLDKAVHQWLTWDKVSVCPSVR